MWEGVVLYLYVLAAGVSTQIRTKKQQNSQNIYVDEPGTGLFELFDFGICGSVTPLQTLAQATRTRTPFHAISQKKNNKNTHKKKTNKTQNHKTQKNKKKDTANRKTLNNF